MDSEFPSEFVSRVYKFLTSPEDGPMERVVSVFLSSDESQKSKAVMFLKCSKKLYPEFLFIKLCHVIRFGSDVHIRAKAIRILQFLRICDFWPKLQETVKSTLKDHFLADLKKWDSMPVLRMFCAVVAEILCETYKDGQKWPELLEFLLTSLGKTSNGKFQEIAFLVLAEFPKDFSSFICDSLKDNVQVLHSSFLNGVASASPNVQVASLGAVVTLVPLFTDHPNPELFHEILRAIMVGVFTLSRSPPNSHVLMAFKELISLVSQGPHLLKPHIGGMVSDMLKIAENSALNDEIDCYAMRLVMTLAEREDFKPIFLSLPYQTMVRLFSVPVKMLLCIKEDMTTNELKGKEDGSTGKANVYNFGLESLYHLSVILGGNKIIPIASELLPLYLESPEWQKRHAGITLLALIGKEFSFETLEFISDDSLSIMFTKFMKLFEDTQFQVRLAAFNFMATPTIFVQLLQLYYHSRLLPAFATALGTEKNDKVKEQVASAILFFLKNTLPDSFSFCAGRDELIMKLLVSVQGDVTPKHKSILLSAFNIVAEKCATVALKFHGSYLPILLEACNDENYEVKKEAARGIRICAESESQEFKHLIKRILPKLYINILSQHPSQASDIAVSTLGRICKCHRDCIDASRLVPIWLSFLPLKEELNEAKIMHEQLCLMVSGSDMDLLGPENQNLAKIIVVFVEVIDKGETLATSETVKTMTHLLGEFRRVIPGSSWDLMLLSMNSQQQQLLSSLVSS